MYQLKLIHYLTFKEATHEQIGLQVPVVRINIDSADRGLFGAINAEQSDPRRRAIRTPDGCKSCDSAFDEGRRIGFAWRQRPAKPGDSEMQRATDEREYISGLVCGREDSP